jgi:hypothetical protein
MSTKRTQPSLLRHSVTATGSSLSKQEVIGSMSDSSSPPPLQIPPRTPLYAQEELGANTGLVEGITSYVMRLANEHSVSVGDLVAEVLAKLPTPHGRLLCPSNGTRKRDGYVFGDGSYSINGVTDRAAAWVDVLEATTGRPDLRLLTLLPLSAVIDDQIFCGKRRWCSLCIEQWREDKKPIYEPLLWGITAASHCPIHGGELSSICNHCQRTMAPLATLSVPGYCSHCRRWLGKSGIEARETGEQSEPVRAAEQVAAVIEMLPKIDSSVVHISLHQNLNAYLEQVASGDIPALARYMQCQSISLRSWLDGSSVLRLGSLVRIATSLDVPASSLLAATLPSSVDIERAKKAVASTRRPVIPLSSQTNQIRQALLDALEEEVPPSLTDVARRLGIPIAWGLNQIEPVLCIQVVERYKKQSGRRRAPSKRVLVMEALEQALQSSAPKRVEQLARDLGYAGTTAFYIWFPDLCAALHEKIKANAQSLLAKVRQDLEHALKQFPPTSFREVCRSIGVDRQLARTQAPDLSARIVERHRDYMEERKAKLKEEAGAALQEFPPPGLENLCSRLDVAALFMRKHFPATMRQIVEQRRSYLKNETLRRREVFITDVQGIATDILKQGIYPSYSKILERLPEGSATDWSFRSKIVLETQRMLGVRGEGTASQHRGTST